MKTIYFLFLLIFTNLMTYSQNLVDSIVIRHCNPNAGSDFVFVDSINTDGLIVNTYTYPNDSLLLPYSRTLYSYSPNYKLIQKQVDQYYNSSWVTQNLETWDYNAADSMLYHARIYYSVTTGIPNYGYSDTITYDFLNRKQYYTHSIFDDSTLTMIYDSRSIFTYDTINHIDTALHQTFNDSLNIMENKSRVTTSYTLTSRKDIVFGEKWVSPGIFQPLSTRHYYYLSNDSIDYEASTNGDSSIYSYSFDSLGNVNMITLLNIYTNSMNQLIHYYYDDEKYLIGSKSYTWFMMMWGACDTLNDIYDSQNRLISHYHSALGDCGRGGQSNWTVYNQSGKIDTLGQCQWTMGTLNCTECAYEYRSVTGMSEISIDNSVIVYPNPANEIITIAIRDFKNPDEVYIYDNQGRMINSIKLLSAKTQFSLKTFTNGIYYLRFENGSNGKRLVKY